VPERATVIWLFQRETQAIRIDTRFDGESGEYVLVPEERDGVRQNERFRDAAEYRVRLEALEQQLETEHWTRTGPFLLRDGWRI
jgi:hypothetical protein